MVPYSQITTPLATIFLIPQHMVDGTGDSITNQALYTHGLKDAAVIFFYTLIVIVVHAVAQEYLLDVSTVIFFYTLIVIVVHAVAQEYLLDASFLLLFIYRDIFFKF